jgi:nucleoside-diphosphate-sugar epimerase
MKVLIVGNMGDIGPAVLRHLRKGYPPAILIGFDSGFFAQCVMARGPFPECLLDQQCFGDVRSMDRSILKGVDAVVNLAAILNDPMDKRFKEATLAINYRCRTYTPRSWN